MENYIKLVKKTKFIGAQPVTLTNKIQKINHYLTEKLDGKRHLLFVDKDGKMYSITSKMEFGNTHIKAPEFPNTVLDTEFYKGKYHVFDMLFYKGKDIRNLPFSERIDGYIHVVHQIGSGILVAKKQIFVDKGSDILNIVKKIENRFKEGKLDGIILTPEDVYYSKSILKYKPSSLLSIDFKIKKKDGKFHLLLQNGQVFKHGGVVTPGEKDYQKYKDGQVVEFIMKNKKFVPIRARPDKENSNALHVILDNYKLIKSGKKLKEFL